MAMYLLFVALVVGAGFLINWPKLYKSFFQLRIIRDMFPDVLTIAAKNTIIYTFFSFSFGLVLALFLALMKMSTIRPYRWMAMGYIELFRGLPALITLILVSFGLPLAFGWRVPFGTAGKLCVGLGLVSAAYMAETIRAGIEAVPRGQMEAARSLGMPRMTAMRRIVLPQAFRIIIPPLTNEMVLLLKDTSLMFIIGTTPATVELTTMARQDMAFFRNATPLTVVALVYLVITLPLTYLVRRLEKAGAKGRH